MKKENRNRGLRMLGLLCLLLCALTLIPAKNVEAASAKKKALKAYKAFLENQETVGKREYGSYYLPGKFLVFYLNADSVPELYWSGQVYTFKKGQVCKIKISDNTGAEGYYKKTGILVTAYAHGNMYGTLAETTTYEKMKGLSTNPVLVKYTVRTSQKSDTTYSAKNKTLSKSAFDSRLKKLVKNKKIIKFGGKSHENTATNRRKYLK